MLFETRGCFGSHYLYTPMEMVRIKPLTIIIREINLCIKYPVSLTCDSKYI